MIEELRDLFTGQSTSAEGGKHVLDAFTFDADESWTLGAFTSETEVPGGEVFGESSRMGTVVTDEREHVSAYSAVLGRVRTFFLPVVNVNGGEIT